MTLAELAAELTANPIDHPAAPGGGSDAMPRRTAPQAYSKQKWLEHTFKKRTKKGGAKCSVCAPPK